MTKLPEDSYDYVIDLLYRENGIPRDPSVMDNLYQTIQNLTLIYKANPDWPDELREDIMAYVEKCINLLQKV